MLHRLLMKAKHKLVSVSNPLDGAVLPRALRCCIRTPARGVCRTGRPVARQRHPSDLFWRHLVEVSVGRVGSDLCDQHMGDIRFVCTKRVATRALLAHAPGARRIASPHRACRAERLRCSAPRFTQRSRKSLCALLYSPTATVCRLYSSRSCSPCKVVAGCLRLRLKRAAVVL